MSPIPLGILAVAGSAPASAYELIQTVVTTSQVSTVTLTNIPQTYKHLQIRMTASTPSGASDGTIGLNGIDDFNNGPTFSTLYRTHRLTGNGSSVSSGTEENRLRLFRTGNNESPAPTVIDVLDYSDSSKNTTFRAFTGNHFVLDVRSGLFMSTASITQILFQSIFATGARFSIYGIKGE
jgi:hypothetical protein